MVLLLSLSLFYYATSFIMPSIFTIFSLSLIGLLLPNSEREGDIPSLSKGRRKNGIERKENQRVEKWKADNGTEREERMR